MVEDKDDGSALEDGSSLENGSTLEDGSTLDDDTVEDIVGVIELKDDSVGQGNVVVLSKSVIKVAVIKKPL